MRRAYVAPAVLVGIVVLIAGIWIGGHPRLLPGFTRDLLAGDDDTRVVNEAIERVHDDYYRDVSRSKLADAAIAGVIASLDDRFSSYFDREEYRHFNDRTDNAYEGIGVNVVEDRRGLRVVAVYAGSPARRAGLRPDDVIVRAEGRSLAGTSSELGSRLIKGRPGTTVRIAYLRDGRTRAIVVRRARVVVPLVTSSSRIVDGDRIGIVTLAAFGSGVHGELRQALERLERRGARGYVLDLRRNPGGLITEAQLVASAFLRKGVVVTTRGRSEPRQTLSATGNPVVPSAPLAVLVDHDSASAAEIVAGALQDHRRAVVVGTRTFGKGVFQHVYPLDNGGGIEIVAGQYFTPSGRNLGGRGVRTGTGITPDVRASDDAKTAADEALPVALRSVRDRVR